MGIFCSWNISLLMLSEAAQTTFSVNRIIEFKLRWSNAKTPKISLPDSLDLKMLRNWRKPSENCKGQKVALWEKNLNFSRYFSVFLAGTFYLRLFRSLNAPGKSNEHLRSKAVFFHGIRFIWKISPLFSGP